MTSRRRNGGFSRDHHVPLRRQLAADLEAGIRDGRISPGSMLPSSRDLARRLRVDRGTVQAALARLRARGFLHTRPGRRPRVSEWETAGRRCILDPMADDASAHREARVWLTDALARAYERGVPRDVIVREMGDLSAASRLWDARVVVLFEPRPGLRAALAAELRFWLGVDVHAVRTLGDASDAAPVLVRRELLPRMGSARGRECIPLRLAGGSRERELVRRRVRSGLVALISVSHMLREYATELAAREFERGVSFVAIGPEETAAKVRAVGAARVVFHDRASVGPETMHAGHAIPLWLLGPNEIESLHRYLGQKRTEGPVALDGRRGT